MSRRTRIIATYRIHEHEVIQVQVDATASYPDAMAEARATARGLVHDLLVDVLAQTRVEAEEEA